MAENVGDSDGAQITNHVAVPFAVDGAETDSATPLERALDQVKDHVRNARDPDRYAGSGRFAIGNGAALKHGKRAKVSLAKRRADLLEAWRADRRRDGSVDRDVDTVLIELADAQAIAERAMFYLEHCRESFTGARYQKALQAKQSSTDRIARLLALLDHIEPPSDTPSGRPVSVTFGGRYRESGELLTGSETSAPARWLPQLPLAIEGEVLAEPPHVAPEPARAEPAPVVEAPQPKRRTLRMMGDVATPEPKRTVRLLAADGSVTAVQQGADAVPVSPERAAEEADIMRIRMERDPDLRVGANPLRDRL